MVAIGSMLIGAVISFLFLDLSWLVGMPSTFVVYTLLKKYTNIEREDEIKQGVRAA